MSQNVAVAGVGMTPFGKHEDKSLRDLSRWAVGEACQQAGIDPSRLQAAFVGNAFAGIITGQEAVRGQAALLGSVPPGIPIFNIESACASSASAFNLAYMSILSGQWEVALVLGVEKLYHPDRTMSQKALTSAVDLTDGPPEDGFFMSMYAKRALAYCEKTGATPMHFAKIAAKNRSNGALNPLAQFRKVVSPEEVLESPVIASPITRMMCSPIGDGAAAAILVSANAAKTLTTKPIWVRASVVASGGMDEPIAKHLAGRAYEISGLGPGDLDLVELHDGAAPAELELYEHLGLAASGMGPELLERGETLIGGRIPVNPGGGLISRGHPVGATGVAQIAEVVWHLRGEAGLRQIDGAKVGLTENTGGSVNGDAAAGTVHILSL